MNACAMCLAVALMPATWADQTAGSGAARPTVMKVTSGDTVVISGVGKVRLLGVQSADAPSLRIADRSSPVPQSDAGGWPPSPPLVSGTYRFKRDQTSRDFLQKLILGKTVRLEYDPLVSSKGERRAYVFLEDGGFVNAEMLRTGHARLDLTREFVHKAEFTRLEEEARRARIGIWISPAR